MKTFEREITLHEKITHKDASQEKSHFTQRMLLRFLHLTNLPTSLHTRIQLHMLRHSGSYGSGSR